MSDIIWHDVECGRYVADFDLWRELAAAAHGPVLDVGAGTGRVTVDLALRGHEVVALDIDPQLLEELRRRAAGLSVRTVVADARSFSLPGQTFPLVIAPMQTVQLLGAAGRWSFLRAARAHLAPGGLVACALADAFDTFDDEHVFLPLPDVLVVDGMRYTSQPVALRDQGPRVAVERIRETVTADGRRTASDNIIHLDRVDRDVIEAEAAAAGLRPVSPRWIAETEEHVGSIVVMLRG
ncbi:MAG TPA: class I SAM-dependent methyltransferase, partial [Solirubrobacteraceae bacterium]